MSPAVFIGTYHFKASIFVEIFLNSMVLVLGPVRNWFKPPWIFVPFVSGTFEFSVDGAKFVTIFPWFKIPGRFSVSHTLYVFLNALDFAVLVVRDIVSVIKIVNYLSCSYCLEFPNFLNSTIDFIFHIWCFLHPITPSHNPDTFFVVATIAAFFFESSVFRKELGHADFVEVNE